MQADALHRCHEFVADRIPSRRTAAPREAARHRTGARAKSIAAPNSALSQVDMPTHYGA